MIEWIPLTDEELAGPTKVMTAEECLQLELEQHYGATPDDPDTYLIALGKYQSDVEQRAQTIEQRMAHMEMIARYESHINKRNSGVRAAAKENKSKGDETRQQVQDALGDTLLINPRFAELSKRHQATRLAAQLPDISERTIRKYL